MSEKGLYVSKAVNDLKFERYLKRLAENRDASNKRMKRGKYSEEENSIEDGYCFDIFEPDNGII